MRKFNGVITPDFSLYRDMPLAMQIWNTYRGKAIGNWLVDNGIKVIPNVRWSDKRSFDFCCNGVGVGGTIAIGFHGCIKLLTDRPFFEEGLGRVVHKLHPKTIVVYGAAPDKIFEPYRKMGISIVRFDSVFIELTSKGGERVMGAGFHGGFGNTYGAIAGDAVFKSEPTQYLSNIAKRADIDRNGVYDVVAHGGQAIIQIESNGEVIKVDSRIAAKLIQQKADYKRGQPIRLPSCDTGSSNSGFAQNLANKLGVIVEAPTKLVWALSSGRYFVAGRSSSDPESPDLTNLGKFKKFYPGGKHK